MTSALIITVCVLLLLAYVFDISASKTKIPSVILLLLLGWLVKHTVLYLDVLVPDLTSILPILGTVGLILIVLEGSLELEVNKSKLLFIGKSSILALSPMLILSFCLAFVFQYLENTSLKTGLINAIPFAIISSAIAIPSAQNLIRKNKEFVTYESSLSDIYGVIFFNFILLNNTIGLIAFGNFFYELILIGIISFLSTVGLAFLLSRINHHVKFVPIMLLVILIYAVSKIYHLPALIFILLFGLFLGNLDEFKGNKFIQKLKPELLNLEVVKFKELITEIAFLIRALFFLLFGYLIDTADLLNIDTILLAVLITVFVFILRSVHLKLMRLPLLPLVFIAPRGLITILLFLSIPASEMLNSANKSLIIQVIILTALVMMFGLMKVNDENETV